MYFAFWDSLWAFVLNRCRKMPISLNESLTNLLDLQTLLRFAKCYAMKARYEDLRTVKQLMKEAVFLTAQKLHWYSFNAKTNGLRITNAKVSNLVYSDRVAFADWMDRHRRTPPNT